MGRRGLGLRGTRDLAAQGHVGHREHPGLDQQAVLTAAEVDPGARGAQPDLDGQGPGQVPERPADRRAVAPPVQVHGRALAAGQAEPGAGIRDPDVQPGQGRDGQLGQAEHGLPGRRPGRGGRSPAGEADVELVGGQRRGQRGHPAQADRGLAGPEHAADPDPGRRRREAERGLHHDPGDAAQPLPAQRDDRVRRARYPRGPAGPQQVVRAEHRQRPPGGARGHQQV